MTVCEMTQRIERETLSPHASLSEESRGRRAPAPEDGIRTPYARDRDRILHCKSFRRLKHKTQVFLSPQGDHYRTRLTHTLEVSQIARTIARGLRLNEDLTEAIALGHDLGHTPFGHAGERTLNELAPFGYKHYLQSVRVVERLEKEGRGLNLTFETKNGIACHTRGKDACTLEGRVVRFADKIAYINHDIEDAITAGILEENELPYDCVAVLGRGKNPRITTMVRSLLENSGEDIRMDPEVYRAFDALHQFMYQVVYTNSAAKREEGKACELVALLYSHLVKHPEKMPDFYRQIARDEGAERAAVDYISGMTDGFAVTAFERIFVPRSWRLEDSL
ncbi:deoxyguanosinetriphosphate triphosphohydrolase [Bittarella massiliensis (ex Durand et al. 2017)]|uniref:Deoxyguanosinetriphosphate triphosphohydrolase n=1 Tax=Bittarella massiliensis (ex Durand et al. 2017) TaxID=1720313 RepID=A0AAW5KAC3_9FIRM|nr:deoxyguanosinetriphosphate triphosphohydrolase [Bittarella massiliensis (ex Durand et al. 2017)]MBC2872142.1 deoxyguanosinetriphosphate triphosphohydrolase [Bittarella massiliensis (ex Durand et al. 2017)]MCQ4949802.1 deoxyguanosinetriphosphate triphosphohydrolase [Bittarella massiliensis (ex Durand et al. 2017)]